MKNGSEVQLGALRGFVLPPHFSSEAENLSRRRRPTFSLEVESNEDTIAEVRVAQSEEVEAKAARNFHR